MGTPDDTELLDKCQGGDEAAWKVLVDRYQNLVFSTALQTGLDQDAAVDVFQQVWMELHRSLLRIRDPQALPRWFIVTTRRISYKHAVVAKKWVSEVREDLIDPAPRADSVAADLELRQRLENGLHALDERCRQVLTMLFYGENKVSYREVGAAVGVAEDTVGSMRTRCLQKLRKILEAEA